MNCRKNTMRTPTQLTFLKEGGGSFQLNEDDFVVFMDETGHELFSDPNYPVFGLGAYCSLGRHYLANVRDAWEEMKAKYYSGCTKPLHASKLRDKPTRGRRAINSFFCRNEFHRIAVVLTDKTCFAEAPSIEAYRIAVRWMLKFMATAASNLAVSRVLLIAEASARLDPRTVQYFSGYSFWRGEGAHRSKVPFEKFFMPKNAAEPGLEVADFIAYSSGKQAQSGFSGKESEIIRDDFESIFRPSDSKYSHFQKIEKVRSD